MNKINKFSIFSITKPGIYTQLQVVTEAEKQPLLKMN